MGWFGDTLLANGAINAQHAAPRGWLPLRLLNGCNARSLTIATSDERPLYVIASDGGMLAEPVKVDALPMMVGERFEVLVDTSDATSFDIVTLPVTQMGMTLPPFDKPHPIVRLQPLRILASGTMPDVLAEMPALPVLDGIRQRTLQLSMDPVLDRMGMQVLVARYGEKAMASMSHGEMSHGNMGHGSMDHANMSAGNMDHSAMSHVQEGMPHGNKEFNWRNGKAFDMARPLFDVPKGQFERWVISGEGDMMLHPFHIHGTQFRILSENDKAPEAHRAGWKDIVRVEGARSEVLVRFNYQASAANAYMAHCHLLEHEDTGMMMGFTVT